MCAQKTLKLLILLTFLAFVAGCDMDDLFPSAGHYKVNILINDVSLDDCSFIRFDDIIRPYFDESVSEDPDVTGLMVYFRDSAGSTVGWRVTYCLNQEDSTAGNERIISVKNLDGELPSFPLPNNIPMDRYTIVTQVMSDNNVLQRTEKTIYYLNRTVFLYEGININLPGITDSAQLIPKEAVVLLEAKMEFNALIDPYIIWYDGKNKISEGKFSDGAAQLFWKAPDQSGFFSVKAEVFPANNFEGLSGYQKEASLVVTSIPVNMHLVSSNIADLLSWYTFEGNLNDSKMINSPDRSLISVSKSSQKWLSVNGTYGVVTGSENIIKLPKMPIPNRRINNWQTLFRFKPISNGVIMAVEFDSANDTYLYLSIMNNELSLTLTSPAQTVSQRMDLSSVYNDFYQSTSFITAGVSFSFEPNMISAQINILGDIISAELNIKPISVSAELTEAFQISLGFKNKEDESEGFKYSEEFNMLWDEFALYFSPPMEVLAADIKSSSIVIEEEISLE